MAPRLQASVIAALREPVVLINSPCDTWRARFTWRPLAGKGGDYLSRRVINPLRDVVAQRGSRSFRYSAGGTPLSDTFAALDDVTVELSLAKLLIKATRSPVDNEEYLYYSRSVVGGEFAPVASDLEPHDFLFVDRAQAGNSTNVWLGGQGVITETHYDMSHNFYLQLDGTKRFVLSPPASYRQLKLHPWIHPHSIFTRQGVEDAHLPSSFDVDLAAGELLYIPPYWFHRVIAPRGHASISVNIWSESQEGELAGLTDVPPPSGLFDTKSERTRRALLEHVIRALLRAVLRLRDRGAQDAFLRAALVDGRLRPHFALLRCTDDLLHESCEATGSDDEHVLLDEKAVANAHATHVARVFAALAQQDIAVHEIVMLNMIESLATDVLGDGSATDGSRGLGSCAFFRCMVLIFDLASTQEAVDVTFKL
eukprot:CAMPEP_0119334640 /NCGR_PEP_ID=MMETSP1333-20130426/87721_1 /TAXON_ID=418940 /ORGANISM="Scyphosphaera apsteinii, Strain RCC1455" /LENGTH=424 /DNA_ID=CAMNT_0007344985 /DNA_START=527 /DNA_END=1799 /DNA_ORIENTATION=-